MSNPISTLPNAQPEAVEPELEVDEIVEADGTPPALEVDPEDEVPEASEPAEATSATTTAASTPAPETDESKGGRGVLVIVLAALLLGSVAINLKQSRDVGALETRSQEYQQALSAAVERIDSEASRADSAEAALQRVDSAVDLVNERVLGLQEALDGLREATVR